MAGSGTIRQRGDAFELRYQHNGKTKTETFRGSRQDAKRRLRELLTRVDQRKSEMTRDTFGEWQERWRESIKATASPMTLRQYETQFRLYLQPIFGMKLRDIDRTTLRMIYADLSTREVKPLKPTSIATLHRCVRSCLSAAVEAGKLDANPATGWRGKGLPRIDDAERAIITPAEARELLQAVGGHWMRLPIVLALAIGLRRSEIAALTWDRVNFETGEIVVSESIREVSARDRRRGPTKTGKIRRLILPAWALAELRGEIKTPNEHLIEGRTMARVGNVTRLRRGAVCVHPNGEPVYPAQMTMAFKPFVVAIGRPTLSFHSLRHTACSWALANGASVKQVQELAGHAKPSITLNIYSHALPDSACDTAARLDRMMQA